jgi:hypothetical protein
MGKRNLNILFISIAITIFGFLLDGDVKEPSTVMRFIEFFAMTGIIFIFTFSTSKLYNLVRNKITLLRS